MSGSDLTDAELAHMLGWQPSIFTRRDGTMSAQIRAIADEAARREREACKKVADAALAAERQAIADICDELEGHWSDYKDAALLNDDVALGNAASGEPRAARAIKEAVLARNGKPFEWGPKG